MKTRHGREELAFPNGACSRLIYLPVQFFSTTIIYYYGYCMCECVPTVGVGTRATASVRKLEDNLQIELVLFSHLSRGVPGLELSLPGFPGKEDL